MTPARGGEEGGEGREGGEGGERGEAGQESAIMFLCLCVLCECVRARTGTLLGLNPTPYTLNPTP